jgi:hypothetical protein
MSLDISSIADEMASSPTPSDTSLEDSIDIARFFRKTLMTDTMRLLPNFANEQTTEARCILRSKNLTGLFCRKFVDRDFRYIQGRTWDASGPGDIVNVTGQEDDTFAMLGPSIFRLAIQWRKGADHVPAEYRYRKIAGQGHVFWFDVVQAERSPSRGPR